MCGLTIMSVALPPSPLVVLQQNAVEDKALVPGAGAFEIAAHAALMKHKEKVVGKPKLGVQVRKRLSTRTTPPYAHHVMRTGFTRHPSAPRLPPDSSYRVDSRLSVPPGLRRRAAGDP